MAKREGNVIDAVPLLPGEGDDDSEIGSELQRFLVERASEATDATVKVYKAAGSAPAGAAKSARDAFLFQCTPGEFTEEFLQAEYGAGSYRVRLYGKLAGRDFGLLANQLLEIGPAPKSKAVLVVQPPAAPTSDGAGIAKAMAEAMAPIMGMLAAMVQKLGDSGGGRKQAMEEVKELMSIVGLSAAQKPAAPDPLVQLTTVLALAKQLTPKGDDSGDEKGPYDLMCKAVETFGGMIAGKVPGAVPAAALPAPAPAAPAAAPAAPKAEDAVNVALKMQLAVLLNAARSGSNPEIYATLIYEQAPDEIIEALESPEWFAKLVALEPGFAECKPWAEQVRGMIVQAIQADAEPEPAAPSSVTQLTTGGGAASVPADAKPSGSAPT